jgi:hypothetical protein
MGLMAPACMANSINHQFVSPSLFLNTKEISSFNSESYCSKKKNQSPRAIISSTDEEKDTITAQEIK